MAATDELVLLERVFLRIGSAETDEQLQNSVSKFLLPVLLKLSSQQEGVRKKVMELLVHINKRIKCRPKIQLPVEALLLQYQDPSATSFVTNFTIIYIKMGYPRLDVDKQVELIPSILNCIEGKPQSHQDSLMVLIMPALNHIKILLDTEKSKNMFGLQEKPRVAKLLLDFMLDVLLLPYSRPGVSAPKEPHISVSVTFEAGGSVGQTPTAPAGLSEYGYKRALGENPASPEELEKIKLGILKFLGGGFVMQEDVIPHLIVASSDTRHSVVNAADYELKRIVGTSSITNVSVISKLYSLFLGTVAAKDQKSSVKSELKCTAANTRIRLKILPYLLKSREAALHFPACIQMVFDCLYGANSSPKLKIMAVQFVHHICLNCNEARLAPIAPVLLSGMVKLITEAKDDAKLRSLAYLAVGKLGNKLPQLVTKDLALLQTFFDAISQEDQDTRLAIQEALLIMSNAFKNLDPANLKVMEALLTSSMEKSESQIRLLAVHFAATVFPPNHIPSRYLLLLAAGDMKEEVYAEAAKTLHTVPTKERPQIEMDVDVSAFPPFAELVNFISEKAQQRLNSGHSYAVGINKLPFNPATCTEMVTYMRLCLAHSAGLKPSLEFSQQIQDQAPALSKYILQSQKELLVEKGPVQLYINFVKQFLSVISGSASMYYLLEMVAVCPHVLAPQFVDQLHWIKGYVFSTKEEMRYNASQLYAFIVVYCLKDEDFVLVIMELISHLKDKTFEHQHGAILALGFILGRKAMLKGRNTLASISGSAEAIKEIAKFLHSSQPLLLSAASTALGEVGRCGILPVPDKGTLEGECSKLSLVNKLTEIVKSSKCIAKIKEKAAFAVSYFCVGEDNFPHCTVIMEQFLECAGEVKDVELHFTIGEALAWTALGSTSPVARDAWTVSEEEFTVKIKAEERQDNGTLTWLLEEIIRKYVGSRNPHVRQATCIWLLSLLKRCNQHQAMKDNLEKLQKIFISLLSENNEITQDLASRGLGLLYECGHEDQKDKLVSLLVDTLMSDRRPTQQVTQDSKIFEEGTLGISPDGGGLSTYKELCSLASDLNQPDLVYQFMHLANHNAIWNSKKGAAFGFGTIAIKAGEQLQPYLPKIIPKLYRYQFDPNTKIQQSMTSIWRAIVQDSQKMVDQYVKEILCDLKVNLTNNAWRTRESSCLALTDLLRGRQLDDIVDDLPELWETCFRVRDDIKESVRLAADNSLNALSKVTIRLCDTNAGPLGQKAIASILPVLLKSGLMSAVLEVRQISLDTLTKIGKSAGALLKPHIPLLCISLLESLSALEQQELNYLSVRLGNEKNTQEKLDNARIAVAKSSSMMATINHCLPFIDEQVLTELVPRLIDLIKHAMGLGTKAGCAHFIISLTHHSLNILQPHAGKLLGALLFGLNDRSGAVRKSYASAIGHLVKAARDSSVEKLIDRLRVSYIEKEDSVAKLTCGLVLHAIAKQSPDVLKIHATRSLPLAFIAMHSSKEKDNDDKSDESVWEDIWIDLTPGSEAGIRLYLTEIIELIQLAFQSQSWEMKAQGAAAVSTIATTLRSSLKSPHLELLLNTVLDGLPGRTWDGKKLLLMAVADICVNFRDAIMELNETSSIDINKVISIMLKECSKENIAYKKEAIKSTASMLHALKEDGFREMFAIIQSTMQKNGDESDDDDNAGTNVTSKRASPIYTELHEIAFEAVGKCWPHKKDTQDRYYQEFGDFLCSALENHVLKVQVSILKALHHYIERLYLFDADGDDKLHGVLSNVVTRLCSCAGNTKSSAIRMEALNIFYTMISKLKVKNKLNTLSNNEMDSIRAVTSQIIQESQTELREKGNKVIQILNNVESL